MCRIQPADESKAAADADKDTFVLSDADANWVQLKSVTSCTCCCSRFMLMARCVRHRHIAEAQPMITERFNQFRSENAMANLGDDASLKQMARAAKQMTSFRTEMQKVALRSTHCF